MQCLGKIYIVILAVLVVSACQSVELAPEEKKDEVCSVFSTKTSMSGEQIRWSKGDRISVTYTLDGSWQKNMFSSSPLKADCEDADFDVVLDVPLSYKGSFRFYAVYPSSSILSNFDSLPEASVELPHIQNTTSSSFDKSADLMVAESEKSYDKLSGETMNLIWKRAVAHAEITLDGLSLNEGERIVNVTLTAAGDVALTGEYKMNVQTGALTPSAPSNSVKLLIPSAYTGNNGQYKMWALLAPSEVDGLEVRVQTDKSVYKSVITDCNLEFSANVRTRLMLDMSQAEEIPVENVSTLLRSDHPRLFLTDEDIPLIRKNAFGRESELYSAMKKRVDKLVGKTITFPDPLAKTGESNDNHDIGSRAAEAAILWLITEDRTYLDATKNILDALTDYYQLRVDNNLNIEWYVFSQVCALCAYDWICSDLTVQERQSLGSRLFNAMDGIAWHGDGLRAERYRENTSAPTAGCYGVSALPWYIALTFWGEGFDDDRCASMFENGYDFHNKMVAHRTKMAGANGGGGTPCIGYALGGYPVADYAFIRTCRAATGTDPAYSMDYVAKYLNVFDWNSLPDDLEGSAKEFGFGDTYHGNCRLPYKNINYDLHEIADIFGWTRPDILPQLSDLLSRFTVGRSVDFYPFIRLLHKDYPVADSGYAPATEKVKYFDTIGQVYMRSGRDDDDTYAMFVSGGLSSKHKHYDNNNFVIYRNGYRALDSGTRPNPGQHLSHYYARTVAHNCVTIRMPFEKFPSYWGSLAEGETDLPVPNDGGQRELLASELKVLEDTDDYVYLASDATGSYNSLKASLVMREFVWCVPDVFVIFDRVTSTLASYPKTWLYHTAAEPVIDGNQFSETSQGGTSICRTLFPADAVLEKIGGPGRQFWSDGRNWPLPNDVSDGISADWPLLGPWRMEVKPGAERKEDVFMHIVQVGDESLTSLPVTRTFETSSQKGVEFEYDGKSWRIAFDMTKNYGCNITIN